MPSARAAAGYRLEALANEREAAATKGDDGDDDGEDDREADCPAQWNARTRIEARHRRASRIGAEPDLPQARAPKRTRGPVASASGHHDSGDDLVRAKQRAEERGIAATARRPPSLRTERNG